MRGVKNNLVGQSFGLLTVFAEALSQQGRTYWRCRCECGRECIKDGHELVRKPGSVKYVTPSCGCRRQTARDIGALLGNPGRITGNPERRHHRGKGSYDSG